MRRPVQTEIKRTLANGQRYVARLRGLDKLDTPLQSIYLSFMYQYL